MSFRKRMGNGGRAAALIVTLALAGCKPPPPPGTPPSAGGKAAGGLEQANPVQVAADSPAANSAPPVAAPAPADDLPDDPVELTRLSNEIHREKIRLIASVQDLETAKAVCGTFPAVNERHRSIEEKLGNRLLSADMKQQLERDFKAERDQLRGEYA